MSNDHQAYLAAKYMSGPKAQAILVATTKSKLRKKSKKDQNVHETITQADGSSSGLKLRDEDHSGWDAGPDGDDLAPVVEEIASFKAKTSASNWTVLQAPKMDLTEPPKDILDKEDEQPLIVNTEKDTFQGGLQTAEQMKKHLKHKISRTHLPNEEQPEQETIYRDGQGRKIDTKQQRADEKRRQAKELEKEMKKMQWGKGLIQREEKKAGAEELSKIASQPFARTIDDKELNQELKEKQRWNDPAASFLTHKSAKSTSKPAKPKYQGPPPPPNRYGIQPGFRWDGVDRSNGFEAKLFQTANDQKRNRAEAYNYSVDEM